MFTGAVCVLGEGECTDEQAAHGCAVHRAELRSLRTACLVAPTALSQFSARILMLRHMANVADKYVGSHVNFPQKCNFILPKNTAGWRRVREATVFPLPHGQMLFLTTNVLPYGTPELYGLLHGSCFLLLEASYQ